MNADGIMVNKDNHDVSVYDVTSAKVSNDLHVSVNVKDTCSIAAKIHDMES